MFKMMIQVEVGSSERRIYNEQTLEYKGTRRGRHPYPFAYGFIGGTSAEDGDCVDCYLLTKEKMAAGSFVECEPAGLLEQFEDDEIDHKVLAVLPGETSTVDLETQEKLRTFIKTIFADHPDINIRVGPVHSREAALNYIRKFQAQ